jgi:hypothetical protein
MAAAGGAGPGAEQGDRVSFPELHSPWTILAAFEACGVQVLGLCVLDTARRRERCDMSADIMDARFEMALMNAAGDSLAVTPNQQNMHAAGKHWRPAGSPRVDGIVGSLYRGVTNAPNAAFLRGKIKSNAVVGFKVRATVQVLWDELHLRTLVGELVLPIQTRAPRWYVLSFVDSGATDVPSSCRVFLCSNTIATAAVARLYNEEVAGQAVALEGVELEAPLDKTAHPLVELEV